MHKTLLEIKGLTKLYNGNRAIEGINLTLYEGNVHALIGENGAGKSTLIKILTGLVTPTKGNILWKSQEVLFRKPQDAIHTGIVAVHQELTLVDTMTVSENIWLGHEPYTNWGTIDFKKMEEDSRGLLEDVGIYLDIKKTVGSLSMADKQLVEFTKAMSFNPELLILDEATSTIGEKEVETLLRVVKKLKERGKSIVFVSHRMKEIFQFCDTCTILKDGLKVRDANLSEIKESEIIQCMTGYEVKQCFPPKLQDTDLSYRDFDNVILEVAGLSTKSGLQDICFHLKSGEILGIGGLQGHGQIELLHALFGMEGITAGKIKVAGKEKVINSPPQAIAEGIQLVPQDRKKEGLFIELNVAENIVPCSLKEISTGGIVSGSKEKEAVVGLIQKLKIKVDTPVQKVRFLSGGNQQKIALGKWLLRQGKIFMMIEPTRGIDINTKMEIYTLLRQLTSKGYGVIISTNELLELVGLCDRVLVMFEKKIIQELHHDEISEQNVLAASFGKKTTGGLVYA